MVDLLMLCIYMCVWYIDVMVGSLMLCIYMFVWSIDVIVDLIMLCICMFVGSIDVREEDESLRQGATKRVIRSMWIPLIDNLGHNVTVLAGHLSQERQITSTEETHIVMPKDNPRDKAVELLQTVERKGWPCLVELVTGMKTLGPLRDLTEQMVIAMEQCGELYLLENMYHDFKYWLRIICSYVALRRATACSTYANKMLMGCQRKHVLTLWLLGHHCKHIRTLL